MFQRFSKNIVTLPECEVQMPLHRPCVWSKNRCAGHLKVTITVATFALLRRYDGPGSEQGGNIHSGKDHQRLYKTQDFWCRQCNTCCSCLFLSCAPLSQVLLQLPHSLQLSQAHGCHFVVVWLRHMPSCTLLPRLCSCKMNFGHFFVISVLPTLRFYPFWGFCSPHWQSCTPKNDKL